MVQSGAGGEGGQRIRSDMGSLFMPHSILGNPLKVLRFLRRRGKRGRLHAALVISRVSMH